MEIGTLLQGYNIPLIKSHRTERGDLISYFAEKMNASRNSAGYKELTIKAWACKLSIFNTEQLYHLRMKCDQAKNFGACFNYYVFPRK